MEIKKIDYSKSTEDIFYKILYPIYAREFLFGDDYESFALTISANFILNSKQWDCILKHWEEKETILTNEELFNSTETISSDDSAKVWFKEKLNQMEIKEDRKEHPYSIFFFIDDKIVMEQDEKNEALWVDYMKIWTYFHSEFNLNYNETSDLIKGMVEEHFKMRSFTPSLKEVDMGLGWKNISK